MKMLKKLLALVLVFAMFAVLPVYAETETAEEPVENTRYTELVDKLGSVGIWTLEKDSEDTINRAEFAHLIKNLVDGDNSGVNDTNFIDVDKANKYYDAIAYMKSYGIMNGIDAERFAPLRTITYNEALKTVLTILGYGDRAAVKGGYPDGYVNIGISLGFKVSTGELTAFDAVKMLNQAAFKVRLMTVIGYKTTEVAVVGPIGNNTVLEQYHDIHVTSGKLTDNGLTQLYTETSIHPDDKMVKVDGIQYKYEGGADIRRALNSTIDCYYKDENGARTLLWWEYTYSNRREIVVYAEELLKDEPSFTKTQLVYRKNKKVDKIAISPRAAFIYNEIAYPTFTVEDLKAEEGWFTLIDENGDNEFEVIFAEVYENYFVISESNNGEIFSDRFYRSVDTSKFEIVEVFNAMGEDIFNDPSNKINAKELYEADRAAGSPARAVAANTVISVFKSKTDGNGEGRYLKIILSDETVTDTLNSIVEDEETGVYTIGNKDYEMNDYLFSQLEVDHSLSELKLGEKYRFYLDYRGQITYFESITAIDQYAYLLDFGTEGQGLKKDAKVKAVLETGEIAVLPLADDVMFNSVKTKEADVIDSADLQLGKQLIRISLNSKGEVRELNTAPSLSTTDLYKAVGYDPTKFSMVLDSSSAYYYTNNRNMIDKYAVAPTTKLFYIPGNGKEEDIRVIDGTQASAQMNGNYKVKAYDADNVHTAKVFVYTDIPDTAGTDNGRYYNFCYIVTGVKGTVNHNGEDVKQIRAWCYDYEYNLIENEPGILPADVKAGDILRIKTNIDERIVKADRIIETKGETRPEPFAYTKTDKTKTTYNKSEAIIYGYPVGRNTLGITVAHNADGTGVDFIPFYTPGIVFFDVENMDCSVAGRTSIPVFATLDEVNNKFNINNEDVAVLVTTSSSGMYDCIIIQY